jgi:hypothetical protein
VTTYILLAIVIALGVLVFLLLGALVEMYRDLAQIREYTGLLDRPQPIELGDREGSRPSEWGLPAELDGKRRALVMFLSDRCATCRTIVWSLHGTVPEHVFLVLEPGPMPTGGGSGGGELVAAIAERSDRVVIDRDHAIADRMGIHMSPSALVVEDGTIARAVTVPSVRQFEALVTMTRSINLTSMSSQPTGVSS